MNEYPKAHYLLAEQRRRRRDKLGAMGNRTFFPSSLTGLDFLQGSL
jgi:hypothetical protein